MADRKTWVCNASPLIVLAKVGRLDLLVSDEHDLVIPQRVVDEVIAGPPDDPARRTLESGWGARVPDVAAPGRLLAWGLDADETSVLAAALETPDSVAVLDDGAARSCARALGVPLIGTLGVVVRAAHRGRIEAAAPVVRSLLAVGLRLDMELVRRVLDEVLDESWTG